LHARFASDTAAAVEVNDAVISAKQRARRADLNTGGIVAVIAAHNAEVAAGMREFTLLDILDPRPEHSHRNTVLFFAGNRAGVTTDTTVVVDYETITQLRFPWARRVGGYASVQFSSGSAEKAAK
jgi:hypothetical protein